MLSVPTILQQSSYYTSQGNAILRSYLSLYYLYLLYLGLFSFEEKESILSLIQYCHDGLLSIDLQSLSVNSNNISTYNSSQFNYTTQLLDSLSLFYSHLSWFIYEQFIESQTVKRNSNSIHLYHIYQEAILHNIEQSFSTIEKTRNGYLEAIGGLCIYLFETPALYQQYLNQLLDISTKKSYTIFIRKTCLSSCFSILNSIMKYKEIEVNDDLISFYMQVIQKSISDYTIEEKKDVGLDLRLIAINNIKQFYQLLYRGYSMLESFDNPYLYVLYVLSYQYFERQQERVSIQQRKDIYQMNAFLTSHSIKNTVYLTKYGGIMTTQDSNDNTILQSIHKDKRYCQFLKSSDYGSELFSSHSFYMNQSLFYSTEEDCIHSSMNDIEINEANDVLFNHFMITSKQYNEQIAKYHQYLNQYHSVLFGFLLKQMCEQYPNTRERASEVLYSLLYNEYQNEFLSNELSAFHSLFTYETRKNYIDLPTYYPLLMRCLSLSTYSKDVLQGVIHSIGGLGYESIENCSLAFLQYLSECKEKNPSLCCIVCLLLLDILSESDIKDSTTLYVLKTLSLFAEKGFLSFVYSIIDTVAVENPQCMSLLTKDKEISTKSSSYLISRVLTCLYPKATKSTSIQILSLCRDLYVHLLDYSESFEKSIKMLMWYLGYSYPIVCSLCSQSIV